MSSAPLSSLCENKIQATVAIACLVTAVAMVNLSLNFHSIESALDLNNDHTISISEYFGGASVFLLHFFLLNIFLYKLIRAFSMLIYFFILKKESKATEVSQQNKTYNGVKDVLTKLSNVLGLFVLYFIVSYVFQKDAFNVLDQDGDGDIDKQDIHMLTDLDGDGTIETEEILVGVAVVGGGSIGLITCAELLLVSIFVWLFYLHVHKLRRDDAQRIANAANAAVLAAESLQEEMNKRLAALEALTVGEHCDFESKRMAGIQLAQFEREAQKACEAKTKAQKMWKKIAFATARLDVKTEHLSIDWRKELVFDVAPDMDAIDGTFKYKNRAITLDRVKQKIGSMGAAGYSYAPYIHAGSNGAIFKAKYKIPYSRIVGSKKVSVAIKVEKRTTANEGALEFEGRVLRAMWNNPESKKYTVQYYGACGCPPPKSTTIRETRESDKVKLWTIKKEGDVNVLYTIEGLGLVMGYYPHGDLSSVLHKAAQELTLPNKKLLAHHFARAMKFLHSLGFWHCDLKPANIMTVEMNGLVYPKIMDYGGGQSADHNSSCGGTPGYIAPDEVRSNKFDVFSFGIIVNEIYMSNGHVEFKERCAEVMHKYGCKLAEDTIHQVELNGDTIHEWFQEIYNQPFMKQWINDMFEMNKYRTIDLAVVYANNDKKNELTNYSDGRRPKEKDKVINRIDLKDGTMKDLIHECWNHKKDERPDFADIVAKF